MRDLAALLGARRVEFGAARNDVALTLPGALLAEADSGTVEITTTSSGLTALTLGDMAADEERVLRVWLGQAAVDAGATLRQSVLLGDGAGEMGRVWIYDQANWQGADLQAIAEAVDLPALTYTDNPDYADTSELVSLAMARARSQPSSIIFRTSAGFSVYMAARSRMGANSAVTA